MNHDGGISNMLSIVVKKSLGNQELNITVCLSSDPILLIRWAEIFEVYLIQMGHRLFLNLLT